MALGGGIFTKQDKVLPGSYINFVSLNAPVGALGERGTATVPMELHWGPVGEVIPLTARQARTDALSVFGYPYDSDALRPVRELFRHAETVLFYRLGGDGGQAAWNKFATAKYPGTRGNQLKLTIAETGTEGRFDVSVYLDGILVDRQRDAATTADLEDNDFVTWKNITLDGQSGIALQGGVDPTVNAASYDGYFSAV